MELSVRENDISILEKLPFDRLKHLKFAYYGTPWFNPFND
jgi:hypothetical protein